MPTTSYPSAPVYVCLDSALQEGALAGALALPDVARHRAPAPPSPGPSDVERAVAMLRGAERPVVLVGRVGRSVESWEARVRVVEKLGAQVLTDLKVAAGFPTNHPLNRAGPGTFVHAPKGHLHWWRNVGDGPGRHLEIFIPAGLERMFEEVGEPAAEGDREPPPPDPARLLEAGPRYGITFQLPDR